MKPIHVLEIGVTALFAFTAIDALRKARAAEKQEQGAAAQSLYRSAALSGAVAAGLFGATLLTWDKPYGKLLG
jgi:hypothetical protein